MSILFKILIMLVWVVVFIMPPLSLQYALYLPARRLFKRIPPHIVYTVCFLLGTAILLVFHAYIMSWEDPDEMEPMDAFDGLILYLLWAPWYLGVLISCIVRNAKAIRMNHSEDQERND